GVGVTQAERQRTGEGGEQRHGKPLVLVGEKTELLLREHEEFGFGGGNRVVAPGVSIQESQAAEEVTAPEAGDVPRPPGAERREYPDRAAPDQIDRVARLAARTDC